MIFRKKKPDISWPGRGVHTGHTISFVKKWEPRWESRSEVTCGKVRCSCGDKWKVGGWPVEYYDRIMAVTS